uniref:Beta-galactosidase-1-like protein 2 n=1 Tax=Gouania willdenowi TaxID=441366 RepID=A0A8C5EH76_GOUWI
MTGVEGLRANSSWFTLEKKPFRILGGSIHYFRVPSAYWEDRLMKMKACGLNTLTTYVPWNLHEPQQGVFDFKNQLDLEAYLRLAGRLGLWVILRPGPYICAEWDLGGLPSWLLRDPNMRLRTTYSGFTDAVNSFFDQLITKVAPLQYSKGGPIIAVQVENEYGSYAKDEAYMPFIKEALLSRGITELLLTSDNKAGLKAGGVKGGIVGMDNTHAHIMMSVVAKLFEMGVSINFYMFHGGTNFGFMNGALAVDLPAPKPMITSYDYDAPLSEAGDYTTKYHLLRNFFSQYQSKCFFVVPYKSERPVNMENLPVNNDNGQLYGYTLYETTISSGGVLNSKNNIRDRALVFVDKEYVGFINDEAQKLYVLFIFLLKEERSLSLLVENCGRVNYGKTLNNQRKGIVGDIEFNELPLRGFIIHSLDMNPGFINRFVSLIYYLQTSFPAFFKGRMYLNRNPKDTFIRLPVWKKGVVFINGQNLGRYWSIGPQQTLYVPGPWLKIGENQIMVFEERETDGKIEFTTTPEYGMTVDVQ